MKKKSNFLKILDQEKSLNQLIKISDLNQMIFLVKNRI